MDFECSTESLEIILVVLLNSLCGGSVAVQCLSCCSVHSRFFEDPFLMMPSFGLFKPNRNIQFAWKWSSSTRCRPHWQRFGGIDQLASRYICWRSIVLSCCSGIPFIEHSSAADCNDLLPQLNKNFLFFSDSLIHRFGWTGVRWSLIWYRIKYSIRTATFDRNQSEFELLF